MKLEFSEAALGHIADQALLRRTGARGLRAVMEARCSAMFGCRRSLAACCLLDLDEEGRELVVLRQFDEYAEAQPADSRAAAASWQRSLLVVDG